jgi:hypothetical protein
MSPNREPAIHTCVCPACQQEPDSETAHLHHHMNQLLAQLNEPQRRWFVGMLSLQPNASTDRDLAQITGLDPKTIRRGRRELAQATDTLPAARQRQPGAGRPRAEKKTPRSNP